MALPLCSRDEQDPGELLGEWGGDEQGRGGRPWWLSLGSGSLFWGRLLLLIWHGGEARGEPGWG